jgi:hypothetical protein
LKRLLNESGSDDEDEFQKMKEDEDRFEDVQGESGSEEDVEMKAPSKEVSEPATKKVIFSSIV